MAGWRHPRQSCDWRFFMRCSHAHQAFPRHKKTRCAHAQRVFHSRPSGKPAGESQLLGFDGGLGSVGSRSSSVSGRSGCGSSSVSSRSSGFSSRSSGFSSRSSGFSGGSSRCFSGRSGSFHSRGCRSSHGSLFLLAASDQSSRSDHGSQDERVFHVNTSRGVKSWGRRSRLAAIPATNADSQHWLPLHNGPVTNLVYSFAH